MHPGAIQHYDSIKRPPSAKDDEYEKEEVFLDEIEERMKKYDKKYRNTDEYNALWNEFGWENQSDRPFIFYGAPREDATQFGRGKKIDPANYVNVDASMVKRQPVPPVQLLTPEQIRRNRGSLANFRELPPEAPSVWKTWNAYAAFGTFIALLLAKENVVITAHDLWEGIMTWGFFGIGMAIIADWYAWLEGTAAQDDFDRKLFASNKAVKTLHDRLEALSTKPDEKKILVNLMAYRETLSEKVLNKSLANQVARIIDSTLTKLQDKISEEVTSRREVEKQWQKQALDGTLKYLEQENVRKSFMNEALNQFTSGNKAKLSTGDVLMDTNLFKQEYDRLFEQAKNEYFRAQKANNTLPWVFRDESDRESERMSRREKEGEYTKRIQEWEQGRNPVHTSMPSFA